VFASLDVVVVEESPQTLGDVAATVHVLAGLIALQQVVVLVLKPVGQLAYEAQRESLAQLCGHLLRHVVLVDEFQLQLAALPTQFVAYLAAIVAIGPIPSVVYEDGDVLGLVVMLPVGVLIVPEEGLVGEVLVYDAMVVEALQQTATTCAPSATRSCSRFWSRA